MGAVHYELSSVKWKTRICKGDCMDIFTRDELNEAVRAITSMINKSEKAKLKLTIGTWQHTATVQSLNANSIAITLLNRELEATDTENLSKSIFSDDELKNALSTMTTTIDRIEKMKPKFKAGTPQHTLAVRRIKALHISAALMKRELGEG
jgi:hypothetical protein